MPVIACFSYISGYSDWIGLDPRLLYRFQKILSYLVGGGVQHYNHTMHPRSCARHIVLVR